MNRRELQISVKDVPLVLTDRLQVISSVDSALILNLIRKVFGFGQTHIYEILVTGRAS